LKLSTLKNNLKTGKTEALQVEFSREYARFTLLYEQEFCDCSKYISAKRKLPGNWK